MTDNLVRIPEPIAINTTNFYKDAIEVIFKTMLDKTDKKSARLVKKFKKERKRLIGNTVCLNFTIRESGSRELSWRWNGQNISIKSGRSNIEEIAYYADESDFELVKRIETAARKLRARYKEIRLLQNRLIRLLESA